MGWMDGVKSVRCERFSRIRSDQLIRSGAGEGMGLSWCRRGKPVRLSGVDAEILGCAAQVTLAKCDAVRID